MLIATRSTKNYNRRRSERLLFAPIAPRHADVISIFSVTSPRVGIDFTSLSRARYYRETRAVKSGKIAGVYIRSDEGFNVLYRFNLRFFQRRSIRRHFHSARVRNLDILAGRFEDTRHYELRKRFIVSPVALGRHNFLTHFEIHR